MTTASPRDPGLPPAYDQEQPQDAYADGDDMQEPAILVLARQSIYAESANSPELYKLNRGVAGLGFATANVELSRVEHSVRRSSSDPTIKQRERHIYNLVNSLQGLNSSMMSVPKYTPHLYAAPVSSRTSLGKSYGFRRIPSLAPRKRGSKKVQGEAVTLAKMSADASGSFGTARFEEGAEVLFEVCKPDKDGRVEWLDGSGRAVAFEEQWEGDGASTEAKIVVTMRLRRAELDALVALWCCRVWERSAEDQPKVHEGMQGVRRKLRMGYAFRSAGLIGT